MVGLLALGLDMARVAYSAEDTTTGVWDTAPRKVQKLQRCSCWLWAKINHTSRSGSTTTNFPEFRCCEAIAHDVVPNRPPSCTGGTQQSVTLLTTQGEKNKENCIPLTRSLSLIYIWQQLPVLEVPYCSPRRRRSTSFAAFLPCQSH